MILLRNIILLLVSFLFVTECQALDCLKHPSYCQIRKNNPRLSHIYALKLSNKIHKVCIKYKVPKRIYTAILAQESMYNVHAVAKMSGFDKNGKFQSSKNVNDDAWFPEKMEWCEETYG